MAYYKSLGEFVRVLEENGRLVRIKRVINKDTELMPLVRWQFRGLPASERKAFLFENVVDAKGKKYNMPVVVGAHAASREIYALAMMCKPEEIMDKWSQAQTNPPKPIMVETSPVHEEIHMGDKLLEHGGLEEIPVPNSTPGFDNAPYLTAANFISKDPETGAVNMANYRAMVKSKTRLGVNCQSPQHMRVHWQKAKDKGASSFQAAIVLGASPNVGLAAVAKVPYGVDELAIAGGIANEPVEMVKCKTIDVEVPASSGIVIEGEIPTDSLEREGPFGEHPGYLFGWGPNIYLNVTCITHRKDAYYNAFISQMPPSESSVLRGISSDAALYKFLKYDCNIPTVTDVALHQNSGSRQFCVIGLKKAHQAQPWQALLAVASFEPILGKMIIAVDDDIDARDPESVIWALCYRMQPKDDIKIVPGRLHQTDPSVAPPTIEGKKERVPGHSVLIDATMKWPYPPVALPKREFMEQAKHIWEEEGLPALTPKVPWYGYNLGFWPDELAEEAELAIQGEYYQTGEKLANQRESI